MLAIARGRKRFLLTGLLLLSIGAVAQGPATSPPEDRYEYGRANRAGIGKIYMGREISHVMGHRGAGWLERSERRVAIRKLHKMTERQARAEMEAIGLRFVENGDFLPQQHFLVFEKPASP